MLLLWDDVVNVRKLMLDKGIEEKGTNISFSWTIAVAANLICFEIYHRNSSTVFSSFNDNTPSSFEFCLSKTMERRDMEELQPCILP